MVDFMDILVADLRIAQAARDLCDNLLSSPDEAEERAECRREIATAVVGMLRASRP